MRKLVVLLLFCFVQSSFAQNILPPKDFLGYSLGEHFTRHHSMKAYFDHVANNSNQVSIEGYGSTNEKRPLFVAYVSSPKNIANLDAIQKANIDRASGKNSDAQKIAIVWLSYNVHGNEASSLDASIKTLHALATTPEYQAYLENTVVVIDPCINPDGRERYVNNYYENAGKMANPDGDDIEHHEPWPGGRPNHYLFDLNRDWAWQTQVESKQRMKLYHQWMPQIHVDYHEQGHNNPYYFAPAAQPFHKAISPWQSNFQTTIGKNHAKYFDQNNWLYFTKEIFDLFYPSYGDSYPIFNGAIGMTYEQAGHGYAGLAILNNDKDTLTLEDRLNHHFTTGISTIEISSKNASSLIENFETYFKDGVANGYGEWKSFVIKKENNPAMLGQLTQWLDQLGIQYGTINKTQKFNAAFSYYYNDTRNINVNSGDLIVSTHQAKARLVSVLFEPNSTLIDSLTYDITGWAVPYRYGVDAYAISEKLQPNEKFAISNSVQSTMVPGAYAHLIPYNSLEDASALSALLEKGIVAKIADKKFVVGQKTFEAGTIILTQKSNAHMGSAFESTITKVAKDKNIVVHSIPTGFVDNGFDFGSGHHRIVKMPKVLLLGGQSVSSYSYGELWHYFENELELKINRAHTNYFGSINLSDYNVLVLPEGSYSKLNASAFKKIKEWTQNGGKLVLIGSALNKTKSITGKALKTYNSKEEEKSFEANKEKYKKEDVLLSFDQGNRNRIKSFVNGAIYKVTLDASHPLAFGYQQNYFTLKRSNKRYAYLENGSNVGTIRSKEDYRSGFVGSRVKNNPIQTLVVGVDQVGSGNIIYFVDNPLFRDFWQNGKLLFANAILFDF